MKRHIIFSVSLLFFLNIVQIVTSYAQVTDETDFTPEWSKGIVWYQIFPERFRNGDPTNDPIITDQEGSYPNDLTSKWQIHPWTSDWYELQPYEKENGKDIWSNIQR